MLPRIHTVRFVEEESGKPGKYRKEHIVSTPQSTASQVTVWVKDITINKLDIKFLLESEE